ncbi:MAG: hypothetical protein ACYTGG_10435 [Planctomycetota bacterium]|jgi:hypothetical protein
MTHQRREGTSGGRHIAPAGNEIEQIQYVLRTVLLEGGGDRRPQIGDGGGESVCIRGGKAMEHANEGQEGVRMGVGGEGQAQAAALILAGEAKGLDEDGSGVGSGLVGEQSETLIERRHRDTSRGIDCIPAGL